MTELMPQTYAYFTDLRLSADGAVEVVGRSFDRRGRRHALDRLPR